MIPAGGAACVVAKKLGNSQAIEWVVGEPSVSNAIDKAKKALRKQGYEYVFSQVAGYRLYPRIRIFH